LATSRIDIAMTESQTTPQIIFAIPPGGLMVTDDQTGQTKASLPLWVYWLQIASRHAAEAEEASRNQRPLGLVKAREVGRAGRPIAGPEGNLEIIEAMIAITGAANAIDAVFGALQQVDPWKPVGGRKKNASRTGEILEQLKHSFVIGKQAMDWSRELDWLFQLRHSIVHHSERTRPMDIAAADAEYIVLSASEAFSLTAVAARRAADFVNRAVTECLEHPKVGARSWSQRAKKLKQSIGLAPGASGPTPTIEVIQTEKGIQVNVVPAKFDELSGELPNDPV
jgi:hypothetical protein